MELVYHRDVLTQTMKVSCPKTSTMVSVAGTCFQCSYFVKTIYRQEEGRRYVVCSFQEERNGST